MVLDHPIHYLKNLSEFYNEIAVDDEEEGSVDLLSAPSRCDDTP